MSTRLVYCPGVCRECGCSDERPCAEGCSWSESDLCSACLGTFEANDAAALDDELDLALDTERIL